MKKWEISVNKFLKDWKENPEVTGIILCGSYITGSPTKHSDVDIQIILRNECKWRERGNKIVDGILMEYFANSPNLIKGYFEDDMKRRRKVAAHMIATGKIILDKNGEVKKLRELANEYLKKDFEKMPEAKQELSKYHLFDMYDNLEEVYHRKNADFNYVYYNFLKNLLESYTEFLGYPNMHEHKTYRFLTNKKDRDKYLLPKIKDLIFTKKFIKAMQETKKDKMLKSFKTLSKYVQIKMGGFNVDGWKFRSPSKIN